MQKRLDIPSSSKVILFGHSGHPPVNKFSRIFNELHINFDVVKHALGEPLPPLEEVAGLVILGAPLSMYASVEEHPWIKTEMAFVEAILAQNKPIFGICFGCQMLAQIGGGEVYLGKQGREFGFVPVANAAAEEHALSPLVGQQVFQAHGDSYKLPQSATHLLKGEAYQQQGAQFAAHAFGVQFHPEITPDVIEKWHTRGLEMGWPHAVNHKLTPAEHAEAAKPILAKTDVWLEGFLRELFGG